MQRARAGDSATSAPPSWFSLAEWRMCHKSLISKVLVALSFLLCHAATGPYSLPPNPCAARTDAQRADLLLATTYPVRHEDPKETTGCPALIGQPVCVWKRRLLRDPGGGG